MKPKDPIVAAFQNNKGVRVQNDVRSNLPAMKKQVAAAQAKFNALPAAAKKAEQVKNLKIAGKFAAETALLAAGFGAATTGAKIVGKVVAKKAYESAAKDVAKKAVSAKYPTSNVKALPKEEDPWSFSVTSNILNDAKTKASADKVFPIIKRAGVKAWNEAENVAHHNFIRNAQGDRLIPTNIMSKAARKYTEQFKKLDNQTKKTYKRNEQRSKTGSTSTVKKKGK
jgi:hypothetical protein